MTEVIGSSGKLLLSPFMWGGGEEKGNHSANVELEGSLQESSIVFYKMKFF